MFPQSEVDNYKLQVELLQEKLQKSEISRQHLEHKLEKILHKRDEHEKVVRTKARHKYQKFLEEQAQRNERNKQLLHMLERIEQQTEAMNARSERLKMMKLQYEMYFAKLVHSQTRRCLQKSVQMMPISSAQPVFMDGYNYVTNPETSNANTLPNSYQRYPAAYYKELQPEIMPLQFVEMPTLKDFAQTEGNDCNDFTNRNVALSDQMPQILQNTTKCEGISNNNNMKMVSNNINKKQDITDKNISYANATLSSVTSSSSSEKKLAEFKENTNVSTTFGEGPNADKIELKEHNLNEIPNATTLPKNTVTNNHIILKNNKMISRPLLNTPVANDTSLDFRKQNNQNLTQNLKNVTQNINPLVQQIRGEVRGLDSHKSNINKVHKPCDTTLPKLDEKVATSLKLEPIKAVIETSSFIPANSNNLINEIERKTEQIENISLAPSSTSVSIENIENEIYGELVSPLETAETQKPENPNIAQDFLENLVTQPENISSEGSAISQQVTISDIKQAVELATVSDISKKEHDLAPVNYEQKTTNENYNNQQTEDLENNFAGYSNYENMEAVAVDESQQQQEQQKYDYSNYDPTQYSYPGYIYDETTGEYKPDPSAPTDQYATDQQYTSEGYEQQYQQQDYDYNQTYTEFPATSSATIDPEPTAYSNYNTEQSETSNLIPADMKTEKEETIPNAEASPLQFDPNSGANEKHTIPSPKVSKPASILATADKNDAQKKKKRVNFVDSSDAGEIAGGEKMPTTKTVGENAASSSESDFVLQSGTEAKLKAT